MQNSLPFRLFTGFGQSFRHRCTTAHPENYYNILRLDQNCSEQDIRNAFVRLSKEFHPDVKGPSTDPQQTAKFVKISEAYNTLRKPKLRDAYDQNLLARWGPTMKNYSNDYTTHTYEREIHKPWEVKPNIDPNPGPYYGVKGIPRLSNKIIALGLVAFGIFGAIFGFASVKHSFTFNQQVLDEKAAAAAMHHAAVRADAQKFGNQEQLRRMVDRMTKIEKAD